MKNILFARLGSRPIPRVLRMMDVASSLGFETAFLAARREEGLADVELYSGHKVVRIGPYFPLLNGRQAWNYFRSVILYNIDFFRHLRKLRPDIVHCSDFETIPAAVVYKLCVKSKLLYNIHDNLAQRYNLPKWAQFILNQAEGLAVRLSSISLVPEQFRRDALPVWCRSKVVVIRNTPADIGFSAPLSERKPIRLFFGGWLDNGRGLRQLLDIVSQNEDFELTIAGEGDRTIIDRIKDNPRVRFLGFITHDQVIQETVRAHVIAALYDPRRPINRFAASNKLAEALACGRPALVNSEMLISESLADYECLVTTAYDEVLDKAPQLIRRMLLKDPESYADKCASARLAYEELYSWERAKEAMIDVFKV